MALKRVTMQQIADACGLSRNTVSKVFNNRGSVPEATKKLVIATARELGYYQFAMSDSLATKRDETIALLAQHRLMGHRFGASFLMSFTDQISRSGYTLQVYEVSDEELAEQWLPPLFNPQKTVGILGIELFDRAYTNMVCALGKPTVFVDAFPGVRETPFMCDFVSMENTTSETSIVRRMIAAGATHLGFVGDIEHCNSFYERWTAFCAALGEAGIPLERELCILAADSEAYGDIEWLLEQLAALPYLPDGFACANDFLATHLITALKQRGLAIPQDVMVTGFGGTSESAIIEPALTTVQIPSEEIGRLAATLLTRRIQLPTFPYLWTYVKTTPIWGRSAR